MLSIKTGEAKNINFEIKENGTPLDLSSAQLTFGVKRRKTDIAFVIIKYDGDFDKTNAANGIVSLFLEANDTNQNPGIYTGEIKISFSSGLVLKTEDIGIVIEKSVI